MNFSGISREYFRRISQEFLETESQNCDPTKISNLGDQFYGISREFPKNQLQEMILKKFLGNSSKKVTTVGESGEIPHFCYLGIYHTRGGVYIYTIQEGVCVNILYWGRMYIAQCVPKNRHFNQVVKIDLVRDSQF